MRLLDRFMPADRSTYDMSWYLQQHDTFGSSPGVGRTLEGSPKVDIANNFEAYVDVLHRRTGPISSAVQTRALVVSQLRFKWRSLVEGDRNRLFGNQELAVLERPGTMDRPTLLNGAEQHVSYAGNAYMWRTARNQLHLLRPDWVSTLIGSNTAEDWTDFAQAWPADAEIVGYAYRAGGVGEPTFIPVRDMAHWMPEPDPTHPWRGLSWVQAVLQDALLDKQATDHAEKFFENAATPQMVFRMDPATTPAQIKEYAEIVNSGHAGVENAFKNLFVGGGADVTVVGSDLKALSLRDMQGGFETRVAVRARIPAAILGVREGLQGSALNSGNYGAARRMWTDGWFAPTADGLASCLERVLTVPNASELTYDQSGVMMLQEDRQDEADIQAKQAATVRQLIEGGYTPDSSRDAVVKNDLTVLQHSGLFSVQLQTVDGKKAAESAKTAADQEDTP